MGMMQKIKQMLNRSPGQTRIELVTERGNGFYTWNGNVYQSDIVRACIRPKVKAVGKLVAKHIRQSGTKIETNPDAYMRFLLEEPNPYMTGQKLQEKLATQLCLNNNAFALIIRDAMGCPCEIYPIPAISAEAKYDNNGVLHLKFLMKNGKSYTFPYADIIHLRNDFNDNDIFGEPIAPALEPLMQIITTTDQGIVRAIKNSAVIRWLLAIKTAQRPEDIRAYAKDFADSFLSSSTDSVGVAAVDSKAEAKQIDPKDYVPNAMQMQQTKSRIYALFNTNEEIVQSKYGEDQWNAYYEAEIEPVVLDLQGEYTRKLFTRRERGFGNRITFEASNLQCATLTTKLNLLQMVDRGALTPNEWRAVFNLAPVDGGDQPIRRLDTRPTEEGAESTEGGEKDNEN